MDAIGKIGVAIPAITDVLMTDLLAGIHSRAEQLGYDTIVFTNASNARNDFLESDYTAGEENIYTLLEQAELDGLFFRRVFFIKTLSLRKSVISCRRAGFPASPRRHICGIFQTSPYRRPKVCFR